MRCNLCGAVTANCSDVDQQFSPNPKPDTVEIVTRLAPDRWSS